MEKARILIVEDEELVTLAIKTYLDGIGHLECMAVTSGEAAIEAVPEFAPDLVLMDIHLEGDMSGTEAARLISLNFHIPVVYLTAYSDGETMEEAKVAQPFGYLVKPFDERSLQATIEMALFKASRQNELRQAKDRMETILRSVGEGIIVTGPNGLVDYMNAGAIAILGREAPQPQTVPILSFLPVVDTDSGAPVRLRLDDILFEGKSQSIRRCSLVGRDGSKSPVEIDIVPYRDQQGSARGMVLTIRRAQAEVPADKA